METRASQIIESLKNRPQDWYRTSHEIVNNEIATVVLISSGMFYVECQGSRPCKFKLLEKFFIWQAFKKWNSLPIEVSK